MASRPSRPGRWQHRRGGRSARLLAGAGLLAMVATGCIARASANRSLLPHQPDVSKLPHTTLGPLSFAPPRNATGISPSQPVMVQVVDPAAHLQSVTVTASDGATVPGSITAGLFVSSAPLRPDSFYTVRALVSLPGSPGSVGASQQTQQVSFSTVATPRAVGLAPESVGPGQAAVVTLSPAARSVEVQGPATGQLNAAGTEVRLQPNTYQKGATYHVTLIATSADGTPGSPQPVAFQAQGGLGISVTPGAGSTNMGVASPVILSLPQAPADPAAFAAAIQVTSGVTPTVSTVALDPTVAPAPAAPGSGACASYAPPSGGSNVVPIAAEWLSATKLQLHPNTADGYWPADTTITINAALKGLTSKAGVNFAASSSSFQTGDKRVIDVNLSSQSLVACRNGTVANAFLISSGRPPGKTTATGHFYIFQRLESATMTSGGDPKSPDYYKVDNVPFTQYFHNGDALHGAWWHNNFGHPMSHGCINVSTPTHNVSWPHAPQNAGWLWNFDNLGDPVIVHGVTP